MKKSAVGAVLALLIFLLSFESLLAQYQIKGIVRDASNGDPVPFASVGILGVNSGTSTNFQGEYVLHSKIFNQIHKNTFEFKGRQKLILKIFSYFY